MNFFTKKRSLSLYTAITAIASFTAFAGSYSLITNHRFNKPMFSAMTMPTPVNTLWNVNTHPVDLHTDGLPATRGAVTEPVGSFDDLPDYTEIRTPEGIFFVTSKFDIEEIVINEYYTENKIVGFEFTFYDPEFNKVGTIKDKIRFDQEKGETGTAHCRIDTTVTSNFFNDDENYEVMVYLGIQTGLDHEYHPNFYEKVYSIGGEKDDDGNDICIFTLEGRCIDTARDSNTGETFITFVDDQYYTAADFPDAVERANNSTTHITVLGKGENGPEPVFKKDIRMTSYPGDTTEGIYMITKNIDNELFYIFSYYEKPYFIDPLAGATDERATHDNNLIIEVMKMNEKNLENVSVTTIPVDIDEDGEQLRYFFYSIGSLTGASDIDMSVNGNKKSPAFILRIDDCLAADLDNYTSNYYVYDSEGNRLKQVAMNSESFQVLNSDDNEQPHIMFIWKDETEAYQFDLVNLYSGELVARIPQLYIDTYLTANCARVRNADGNYIYAFVCYFDEYDEDYTVYKCIAWFNEEGELDHIDRVNIGKDVQASTVNMTASNLNPYLYDTDAAMEYAVLVKRTSGDTVRNEFVIVDDSGEWYAIFSEDDGRGDPLIFTIDTSEAGSRLYMIYQRNNSFSFNVDVYNLPFETLAVKSILDESGTGASFEDGSFIAPNSSIEIYTSDGVKVAVAKDVFAISNLAKGVYVAVIKSSNGKTTSLKFTR